MILLSSGIQTYWSIRNEFQDYTKFRQILNFCPKSIIKNKLSPRNEKTATINKKKRNQTVDYISVTSDQHQKSYRQTAAGISREQKKYKYASSSTGFSPTELGSSEVFNLHKETAALYILAAISRRFAELCVTHKREAAVSFALFLYIFALLVLFAWCGIFLQLMIEKLKEK